MRWSYLSTVPIVGFNTLNDFNESKSAIMCIIKTT